MRITEGMITNKYLFTHRKLAEKQLKTQTQLATNSKIETISDDVLGSLEAIDLNSQIKKTNAYIKNTETANNFLTASLNSLDSATTAFQNIMTISTNANNALNHENYPTMAQSVKDSLAVIVQSINEKSNGMNLFGGTNYQNDPVSIDATGKAVKSMLDHSGEIKVQISNNTKETMNIPGSQILNSGVFEAANDIIDALNSGTTPTSAQLTALNTAYNNLLDVQSLAGEKMNRFSNMTDVLKNRNTINNEMLVDVQGIDTVKLSADLQQQDYLLQVSYKLLANSLSTSILDYL